MVENRVSFRLWMVMALGALSACGGNVEVSAGGNGGNGGNGGEGGTGAGTTTTTAGTGGNTGGTGGVGGGTGGQGAGVLNCEGLGQLDCMDAFPTCVPVYDDECCPTCHPGGCADCTNIQFHHCASRDEMCSGGPAPNCGFTPGWACAGEEPDCESAIAGVEPCSGEPGCVPAYCANDADCTFEYTCHPVKPNMCVAVCAVLPPACPSGTAAEADGSCWTGFCIPQDLCAFQQ